MLAILPLQPQHAGDVLAMIGNDAPEHRRFFSGLPDDEQLFADTLRCARDDAYWGIWKRSGELSAMFMLRGLDAGYPAPAFGVYVRAADSSRGLARLAMNHSLCHCRLSSITEIMLTVDEDNEVARGLYQRMGFVNTGETSPKGQAIYRRKVDVE